MDPVKTISFGQNPPFRTLAVLTFCLLPLGARAFDLTLDPSRVVSDPSYLPLAGQLYGSSEYTYGKTDSNTNDALGNIKSANSTTSNTVNQVLEYGITDDFAFRVGDSYEWPSTTFNYPSGLQTTTHSDGFIDPSFAILWRAVDQKDHPFSWDLTATYAPNLFPAQSADPSENGTVGRGGDTETLGMALSQKMKDFTFYLQGTVTYLDDRSVLNLANNINIDYSHSLQYLLNIATQTRLDKQWSFNLNYAETFYDNANASYVNSQGKTISSISQSGQSEEITAALNYHLLPNRFVLSVIYNHYFFNEGSNTNLTLPANSTTTNNKEEDLFNGELRYVFN